MAKDPVCGMNVGDNSQFTSNHDGVSYRFCSASCKAKFDKEPDRYAEKAAGGGGHVGHHHRFC